MSYQLSLTLVQQPEVLERVLRVVRHRGFKVTKMDMQLEGEQGVGLAMHVEGERAIELLTNQLDKLFDVVDCRVHA
ncbi:acetolactate synthase 2 small subunit [Shewanella psychropiezotolerans]|uniref:Acetolactate synthase 2 small subunit n=1 Tax=Shewanella psychropiezotolerans TaxID=2593655 RepID=A0ABX5X3N9_9GAMM|nr:MULTISPECIES: acetolactate synthase 2 small subunit [Shewanella]MPY25468.1 acetolactate synthase 2 small subunit [Shewanella sp. YLB-07]QDO85970.1 acetolactate synthase 2 small subunit [Shewanella psychropiezotolerans]